jgi:hypothetical protein
LLGHGPEPSLAGWGTAFSRDEAIRAAQAENKSQKVGVFFATEKVTAKTPRLPRKPPQLHHQKTTLKTRFLPKTPAKTLSFPTG